MKKRKDAAEKKSPIQPFLVVIGKTNDISSIFMSVDGHLCNCPSLLEGVDTLFKTFFTFNLSYPTHSLKMWLYFQICIFDIKINSDPKSMMPSILTLANDLNIIDI